MSNELFQIGPFHITLLGVFSLLGIVAGLVVLRHEARRKGYSAEIVDNTALVALISAIAGARLYYAFVFAQGGLVEGVRQFLAFNQGGLSIQGALIGGVLGAVIYLWGRSPGFWEIADVAAPAIILGQAIGRIGCDVFGVAAPGYARWAVQVGGRMLHPVQLYESMLNYLLFLLVWYLRGRTVRKGELFLVYITGFAFNRFVVEFFRTNPTAIGSLTVAHVTAVVMAATALAVLMVRRRWPELGTDEPVGTAAADHLVSAHRPAAGGRAFILVPALMVVSILAYYGIYW